MINDRVILSPFAWYADLSYQEQNNRGCHQECLPYLIAPKDRLLPFQIRIPKSDIAIMISSLDLMVYCGTSIINLNNNLGDLTTYQDLTHAYIIYKGDTGMEFQDGASVMPLSIPQGTYYARLITNKGTFYSELFCVKQDLSKYMMIEWYNGKNFPGEIVYETGYKNRIYLDAILTPPAIGLEEDSEKDEYGNPVPVLQRFVYQYTFAVVNILHSAAVALSAIPLHTHKVITLGDGRSTEMAYPKVDPDFLDCGAIVKIQFQEAVVIKTPCT